MPSGLVYGLALAFGLWLSAASSAPAADYPERPIRVVVPYAGAGTTDIAARILFERVSQMIGQPVLIENRPGAGGNIGTEQVVKSVPDRYTLVLGDPIAEAKKLSLYRQRPPVRTCGGCQRRCANRGV
jgi:tripartite-type tricarboxylate transporter receptor subunit TctC